MEAVRQNLFAFLIENLIWIFLDAGKTQVAFGKN